MNAWVGERPIPIVSAVMTAHGTPAFAATTVAVTHEQYENGIHYYLAEAELLERGYEEPFVHFADAEAPSFLVEAMRQQLAAQWQVPDPISTVNAEEVP